MVAESLISQRSPLGKVTLPGRYGTRRPKPFVKIFTPLPNLEVLGLTFIKENVFFVNLLGSLLINPLNGFSSDLSKVQ